MIEKPPSPPFSYCYQILKNDIADPSVKQLAISLAEKTDRIIITSVQPHLLKTKLIILKHNIKASSLQ